MISKCCDKLLEEEQKACNNDSFTSERKRSVMTEIKEEQDETDKDSCDSSRKLSMERYQILRKEFGDVSSWAVWAPEGETPKSNVGDLSAFQDAHIIDILNPDYVLVGLNASNTHVQKEGSQNRIWGNFHSTDNSRQQDFKLRYALINTPYWGAYMTDIIKRYGEVDSEKVGKYLSCHPEVIRNNIIIFEHELELLGTTPVIVALGNKVYEILDKNFSDKYKIIKVKHYSARISKEQYREEFLAAMNGMD
jgi:hypothetical protein